MRTFVTSPAVLDALAPREFPTNGISETTASAPASPQPNLHPSHTPPAGGPSRPLNDSHARPVPARSRHSTPCRSFGTRMRTAACGARSRPTRTRPPRTRHLGTPQEGRPERRRHPTNRPPTAPLTWRGDQNSVPLAHRHPQTRKPPTGSGMPDSPCAPAEGVQRRRSAVAQCHNVIAGPSDRATPGTDGSVPAPSSSPRSAADHCAPTSARRGKHDWAMYRDLPEERTVLPGYAL
jgi:hypothetical protein